MPGEVAVLLTVGRHPVSGCDRASPTDASALELALRADRAPLAIHAGDPANPALRDYLGMGLDELHALGPATADDDVVPALVEFLRERMPRLVICGTRAEQGEGSGMLPYLVAARMNWPIVADVTAIELGDEEARVSQAQPGGRRRRIAVALPAVLTVGRAGPRPRQWAFARARRGRILTLTMPVSPDSERAGWERRASRARPRRLRPAGEPSSNTPPLIGLSPQDAAKRLHTFLLAHGVIAA
jgi:electron transfer flavoprotein beta subunit